jgi:cytochrome P450
MDILAALHDSRLSPVGTKMMQFGLSASQLAQWQSKIEPFAHSQVMALPEDRPADLVSEFAEPWSATVALVVTGARTDDRERLVELARLVSAAAAAPDDPDLKSASVAANAELERSIPATSIPMPGAAFVALSQTLPAFLASAWLALLRHPNEVAKLYANPTLMPAAIEELLRYAGLARRIIRIAQTSIELGGAQIAAGQKVALMLRSANRDPQQFPEPNRLDLMRRTAGHLAFGMGPHSCVGASLIRMVCAVATIAFVQRFHAASVCEPVQWRGGTGFRAPAVLLARFREHARAAV